MSLPRNRTTVDSLPPETLHDILVYLKHCKNDLASTCLVSKRFRSISLPILYETVVLTPPIHQEFWDPGVFSLLSPVSEISVRVANGCRNHTNNDDVQLSTVERLALLQKQPTTELHLDARQNMLQGAWVFGPDDLESSGIIAGSLFKFLNTKVQLRDLHLEGIHDMDTILNVFNNFDRMPNKLQRLTVQLQDSNFLESS
ncbi:hypothetical protein TWF594_007720 [Orbilia oligospora]|nr:hypothetical protein TWF103_001897 [Orbilia oligospora]KAF3136830.1 hypothetical protein TWF594_007720 [Orbilia oligospora]